jgi:hypothetical protein
MIDDECEAVGGMRIGRGNRSTRRKPATLSTTNPTWPDPGLNPGRRGRKSATNRLSYGAALDRIAAAAAVTVAVAVVTVVVVAKK